MDRLRYAHSSASPWQSGLDACMQQLGKLPATSNLGFLYVTDPLSQHLGDILREIKQRTGVQHWVGSVGLAICATATEYYDEAAMAMLVGAFPEGSFQVFSDPTAVQPEPHHAMRFAIVHGDPRNGQLPRLLTHLPQQLGEAYLVGGLTSANQYHYQIADGLLEGQLSGVVFDMEKVPVVTGLTQGCSPLGKTHIITECDGNIAIALDQRPALAVMKEEIGEVLSRDLRRVGGYIFAGFPVSGSDTGDYLVRNLIGIDPEQQVLAIGEYLQQGSRMMFCRRDGRTAVEDLQRMLRNIKSRLQGPAKGGLYISCMGRGQHMFGEISAELKLIQAELGDIPLVGFYANGEIAGNRLYGYTGVLTLFQ